MKRDGCLLGGPYSFHPTGTESLRVSDKSPPERFIRSVATPSSHAGRRVHKRRGTRALLLPPAPLSGRFLYAWGSFFMSTVYAEIGRYARRSIGEGAKLDQRLRSLLEACFHVDLSEVRVHTGAEDSSLTQYFGADALTIGSDIFFRDGRFNAGTRHGLRLLAHEVAHAIQQAHGNALRGHDRVAPAHDLLEYVADRCADRVVEGRRAGLIGTAPRKAAPAEALLVQCHSSWEHRLFGDVPPTTIDTITQSPTKEGIVEIRNAMLLWQDNPVVAAAEVLKNFPSTSCWELDSGLPVTIGDLNMLPDYLASPDDYNPGDPSNRSLVVNLLQSGRQETVNRINKIYLNQGRMSFKYAALELWNDIGGLEIDVLDEQVDKQAPEIVYEILTKGLGDQGKDHYFGLLARNACHFVPFSWWRWKFWYTRALRTAYAAYDNSEGKRAEYTSLARVYGAYANHFLQDSFAAGHVINKTLVMQWFIDWLGERSNFPSLYVPNWTAVQSMGGALQPKVAGGVNAYTSPSTITDPQTGQEHTEREQRISASGVTPDDIDDPLRETNYNSWIYMISSMVVQVATSVVHDGLNARSLWVASPADETPYRIWGDDTMVKDGDGARIAAQASQMSATSVEDVIQNGSSEITADSIQGHFPSMASMSSGSVLNQDILTWHSSELYTLCTQQNGLFDSAWNKYYLASLPIVARTMGKVSVDL